MTLEELKEKARLTDKEIEKIVRDGYGNGNYDLDIGIDRDISDKATDKALQTFIQLCEEQTICQVVEVELPNCRFCEGTGLIGGTRINDRCDDCDGSGKDKKFLKPVSEVLRE